MKKLVTLCLISISCFLHAQIENSPQIFAEFPFLMDVYPDCTDIEFQVITSGIFVWIYVSDGSLYFQDGGLFCTGTGDRDCRELYGLFGSPTTTFNCNPAMEQESSAVELLISDSFVDPDSDLLCANVTTSGTSDVLSFQFQLETAIKPVSFTSDILDASTIVVDDEDSLFVIKSLWIAGDLIPIQLENGDPIYTVCFDSGAAAGTYDFTLRDTDRLFSQFVVRDASGNFREIRDITVSGNVTVENDDTDNTDENSESENEMDEDEMNQDEMDEDAIDENEEEEEEGNDESGSEETEGVASIEEAFLLFPWLRDLEVCGRTVVSYASGNFTFVAIGTGENLEMYFEDGTFYCSNSATFNCLEFYGLSEPTGMWECVDDSRRALQRG